MPPFYYCLIQKCHSGRESIWVVGEHRQEWALDPVLAEIYLADACADQLTKEEKFPHF